MNDVVRRYGWLDRFVIEIDAGLRTVFSHPKGKRPYPAEEVESGALSDKAERHSAGLMRVNHCGEVCAQALYRSQALFAQDQETVAILKQCADEEIDHLDWCVTRLDELNSHTSYANVFWYAHSFFLGTVAALAGDAYNLGFVEETERQVTAHLQSHLDALDAQDLRSLAVVQTMQEDEARHADTAHDLGAEALPAPVRAGMRLLAKVMTVLVYRI